MSVPSTLFGSGISSIDATQAHALQRAGAVVVDVREQGEWDAGHIAEAEHHPLGGLASSMRRLPEERSLVVVCRSGNRSARAAELLSTAGFDAVNLDGGMTAWAGAGLPVVDDRGNQGSVR